MQRVPAGQNTQRASETYFHGYSLLLENDWDGDSFCLRRLENVTQRVHFVSERTYKNDACAHAETNSILSPVLKCSAVLPEHVPTATLEASPLRYRFCHYIEQQCFGRSNIKALYIPSYLRYSSDDHLYPVQTSSSTCFFSNSCWTKSAFPKSNTRKTMWSANKAHRSCRCHALDCSSRFPVWSQYWIPSWIGRGRLERRFS
jgi:hypothetical protein